MRRIVKYSAAFSNKVSDNNIYHAVFNLELGNGDAKQILLVNRNWLDWSDFEMSCFLWKVGLTGVILKCTFLCNHSSVHTH